MADGDRRKKALPLAVPTTSAASAASSLAKPCRRRPWSVFDAVRSFPSTPESLMSQIDAAIASTEYTRACALLSSTCLVSTSTAETSSAGDGVVLYDTAIAEEAYRAAVAAMDADRPDAAVRSLRVALASCPPDRPAAVNKLRTLLARANALLKKPPLAATSPR